MLDTNDLNSMREMLVTVLKEEVPKIVEDKMGEVLEKRVPTMIEEKMGEVLEGNILPALDALADEVKELKNDMKEVKRKLTTMPDRDEVARMMNEATGSMVVKVRTEDKKVNAHIDYSKENGNLSDEQYQELKQIEVFPTVRS